MNFLDVSLNNESISPGSKSNLELNWQISPITTDKIVEYVIEPNETLVNLKGTPTQKKVRRKQLPQLE